MKCETLIARVCDAQPMSMVLPGVVGFKLTGKLRTGVTATDLVLTVTQILRKMGVVGKFVEFYGKQSRFFCRSLQILPRYDCLQGAAQPCRCSMRVRIVFSSPPD